MTTTPNPVTTPPRLSEAVATVRTDDEHPPTSAGSVSAGLSSRQRDAVADLGPGHREAEHRDEVHGPDPRADRHRRVSSQLRFERPSRPARARAAQPMPRPRTPSHRQHGVAQPKPVSSSAHRPHGCGSLCDLQSRVLSTTIARRRSRGFSLTHRDLQLPPGGLLADVRTPALHSGARGACC